MGNLTRSILLGSWRLTTKFWEELGALCVTVDSHLCVQKDRGGKQSWWLEFSFGAHSWELVKRGIFEVEKRRNWKKSMGSEEWGNQEPMGKDSGSRSVGERYSW